MLAYLLLTCAAIYFVASATTKLRAACVGYEFASSVLVAGWMLYGVVTYQAAWIEAALLAQGMAMYLPLFWRN